MSSFGISGTNAHVILEEPAGSEEEAPADGPALVLLSAKSEQAVRDQARRLRDHVAAHAGLMPAVVAAGLATRAVFDHRAAFVAADRDALLSSLDEVAPGAATTARPVFVFPGQGSQWVAMARELTAESEVFRTRLEECANALAPYTDWSLLDVLHNDSDALERVEVVQPVLWAMMVSLAELWRAHGVEPAAVIGHSQGEIAAATVTGALSLDDGARVVALRSKAIRAIAGRGGMMSVGLPQDEVAELLAGRDDVLSVAAVNGARSVVVSGAREELEALRAELEAAGHRARMVAVDYASHSAHVEEIRAEILAALAPIRPRSTGIPFLSTVTGEPIDTAGLDAEYWYRNLRSTVRFDLATRTALRFGHTLFVESSAHPVLVPGLQETLDDWEGTAAAIGTLRRDDGGLTRFLGSLGEAFRHGARPVLPAARADLPTYPFQHERFWLDVAADAGDLTSAGLRRADHPLLAASVELGDEQGIVCTGRISLKTQPWLADHAVLGTVLVSGTTFVELAGAAGARVGSAQVVDLTLENPLPLEENDSVELQVVVGGRGEDERRAVAVFARSADEVTWTRHATGVVAPAGFDVPHAGWAVSWPPAGASVLPLRTAYDDLAVAGYDYGPAFRGLRGAWRDGDAVYAEVALPAELAGGDYGVHPALLDAALHPVALGLVGPASEEQLLPFAWSGITTRMTGTSELRVRLSPDGAGGVRVEAADSAGRSVLSIDSLSLRPMNRSQGTGNRRAAPSGVDGGDDGRNAA